MNNPCPSLQVACERERPAGGKKNAPAVQTFKNEYVKSGDLVWVPQGEQETVFAKEIPAPTNKV